MQLAMVTGSSLIFHGTCGVGVLFSELTLSIDAWGYLHAVL